jgi:adenylate cyclase
LLAETAKALFAGERDQRLYHVLDLTYLNPAPKQEAAASRLGLPYSTYRRHLTAGVDRLTEWLWKQELEVQRVETVAEQTTGSSERVERKLAAVLAADVAGYSRLMGADEEGTLRRLNALRTEVIDPTIAEHHGRIVKTTGDGLLVEFASVVDAMRCAIAWQTAMVDRNTTVPGDSRIEFRIGVNLGDIIIAGDDIYGDGVNIAARLEAIAEPGGICIERSVLTQSRGKVDFPVEDIGEQALKNIAQPVHVLRVLAEEKPMPEPDSPALSPLDKPSIAVLPFQNMSGDPEQEYFVDGIVEEITTAIARLPWLFVTARNSSFIYKGQPVDVKQVGCELGVRYVLEGSVRKAGSRVRITAQLIDAATGHHLWVDRYDRELADVFAVQDELAQNITGAIAPGILSAEIHHAQRKEKSQLDAWDRVMRAHWHIRRFTPSDLIEARRLLAQVIALDPSYSMALIDLAFANHFEAVFGWGDGLEELHAQFGDAARAAVAANDNDAMAQAALALYELFSSRHAEAERRLRRALVLDPNLAFAHGILGGIHAFGGDYDVALPLAEEAIRLSPRDPFVVIWRVDMAWAALTAEHYEEASDFAEQTIADNQAFPDGYAVLAAASGHLGRADSARAALDELSQRMPGLTASDKRLNRPFRRAADQQRFLEGLRKAGMPET